MVSGANGVAADLFKEFQPALPRPEGNSRSQAAGIVVEADTFKLSVLAVEPKAGGRIKAGLPDAKSGESIIEGDAAGANPGRETVKRLRVEG
jgi:hypothetical protein